MHSDSMKTVKIAGGGNCCGVRYWKGLFLLLMTSTLLIYMLWDIAKARGGILQIHSPPSILPYVHSNATHYVTSSVISRVTRYTTGNVTSPITAITMGTPPPLIANPHNFRYIIQGNNTCRTRNNTTVFLLISVCIAPANLKHREVIRNTWGSITEHNEEVRLIFLLGKTNDEVTQTKINNESKQFKDIVQEDFVDSYRNLSLKSVAMLKWTMTYCNSAKYVLKVDDDIFMNIPYLIGVLKHKHITNGIIGTVFQNSAPNRSPSSKWHTSLNLYKEAVYPKYVSGTAYVISGDIVSKLYYASLVIPLFWLEDVYITGLCRRKIGADAVSDYGFTYAHRSPTGCDYRHVISGHDNTPEEITKIWQELNDPKLKCL